VKNLINLHVMGYNKIPRQKLPRSKKNKIVETTVRGSVHRAANNGRSSGSNHKDEIKSIV